LSLGLGASDSRLLIQRLDRPLDEAEAAPHPKGNLLHLLRDELLGDRWFAPLGEQDESRPERLIRPHELAPPGNRPARRSEAQNWGRRRAQGQLAQRFGLLR